jgi:hypothetical protein
MEKETYNGWTNYETWKVNLELLDGLTANYLFGKNCEPDEIQNYVEDILEEECQPSSFSSSCVRSFLSKVNWHEIAEHLNED